jgi:hypothetical protein
MVYSKSAQDHQGRPYRTANTRGDQNIEPNTNQTAWIPRFVDSSCNPPIQNSNPAAISRFSSLEVVDCQISVRWLAWEAPNDAVIEVGVVESCGGLVVFKSWRFLGILVKIGTGPVFFCHML